MENESNNAGNKELWAALFAVQGEVEGIVKDATNPHYKSSYADRTSILETIRPVLAKNGLLLIQALVNGTVDTMSMATSVVHVGTGQALSTTATMPLSKSDPQGFGSAATYLSRYALVALFALPLLDDDANAASGKNDKPAPKVFKNPVKEVDIAKLSQSLLGTTGPKQEPASVAATPVTTAAAGGTSPTGSKRKLWGTK